MVIKLTLLVLFFASMLGVGVYSRKHATNVTGFVLGGRSVGPWLTAFAYGTTYFSAVVFIGYAGQFGWKFGIASVWIGIGNALLGSMLAWIVLAKRTRIMTHHLTSATMPDYFGKRYDSKNIRLVASAIAFIFLIPYTASVYNGLSTLFKEALGIDLWVCIIAMAALTGVYVVIGGYMATAINDFIQGIIMLFGIVAVIIAVLSGHGGFIEAFGKMGKVAGEGIPAGSLNSLFGPAPLSLLSVIILTSLGTWGLPQMIHKFYTIKDEKAVKTGTIISTVFALVIAGGSYFLGGFGRLMDTPANESVLHYMKNGKPAILFDNIVPLMIRDIPDILVGIVIVLVLSASMSTLSSLVLTSSSTLTLDFIKGTFIKEMSEKKQLFVMRILIVFFIVLSVVIALLNVNFKLTFIAQLMGISWGALAGSFLAPFLYGLYWKGVTRAGVWACFIVGVGLTVTNLILDFFFAIKLFPTSIEAGATAMVAGLIIVPLVSFFTPKIKSEKITEIFSCYNK